MLTKISKVVIEFKTDEPEQLIDYLHDCLDDHRVPFKIKSSSPNLNKTKVEE